MGRAVFGRALDERDAGVREVAEEREEVDRGAELREVREDAGARVELLRLRVGALERLAMSRGYP